MKITEFKEKKVYTAYGDFYMMEKGVFCVKYKDSPNWFRSNQSYNAIINVDFEPVNEEEGEK